MHIKLFLSFYNCTFPSFPSYGRSAFHPSLTHIPPLCPPTLRCELLVSLFSLFFSSSIPLMGLDKFIHMRRSTLDEREEKASQNMKYILTFIFTFFLSWFLLHLMELRRKRMFMIINKSYRMNIFNCAFIKS